MQVLNGFIKIHRKLMQWGWYTDNVVKGVFLHLLLTASYKDSEWMGRTIKKGQVVTTYRKMAEQLGLSVQQVRTALEKLSSTNEVTVLSTNKFTLITVVNWGDYQLEDKVSNKRATNEQQTKTQHKTCILQNGTKNATHTSTNKKSLENGFTSEFAETENNGATQTPTNEQQTNNKQITNEQHNRKNIKNNKNIENIYTRACAREGSLDFNSSEGFAVCDVNSLFEKFWEVYPNKINRNKAFAEFKKLNADEALLNEMIKSIALWKRTRQWSDPDFIPQAKTWLNNKSWETVPPTSKKVTGGGYEGYPEL